MRDRRHDVWAFGATGAVAYWNGVGSFKHCSPLDGMATPANATGFSVSAWNDVWATGATEPTVFHWNGYVWHRHRPRSISPARCSP